MRPPASLLTKACRVALMLATAGAGAAQLRLPRIFSDGMVLQQGVPVPFWGWAPVGETVTVSGAGQSHATETGKDGRWRITLKPLAAGGPVPVTIRCCDTTLELQDVLVGEVWLCSGQSNMAWPVSRALNPDTELAAADYPQLRLFHARGQLPGEAPRDDVKPSCAWQRCTGKTIRGFSAAGYFFARELQRTLDLPVGIINCSIGGTPIEAWTSCAKLAEDPDTADVLARWELTKPRVLELQAEYKRKVETWEKEAAAGREQGEPAPKRPLLPKFMRLACRPGVLYNSMIHPLIPLAIRGVIWYQGESGGEPYGKLLPAMITDWRTRWKRGDLPFCVGQLHNVYPVQTDPNEKCRWGFRREAQLETALALPNVGLTVSIDLGEAATTHYPNKQEVGRRFALWALGTVYGRDLMYSGPIYSRMQVENSRVRLHFEHVGEGLRAKGDALRGFVIAGNDRTFHWARARIHRDTVVVWSDNVAKPVAVRYGWAMNPVCTLYNAAGLPASPFRTDDW